MKDKKKQEKKPRNSISRLVFRMIREGHLYVKEGKDEGLKVAAAVKKQFTKAKFDLTQYFWYLSRFRRQKKLGLSLDHLVAIDGGKKQKAKTNGKAKVRKHGAKAKAQPGKAAPAKPQETRDAVEA